MSTSMSKFAKTVRFQELSLQAGSLKPVTLKVKELDTNKYCRLWDFVCRRTQTQNKLVSTTSGISKFLVVFFFVVLRKKGSKTKKSTKEVEIQKGDCRLSTRKFFLRFCRTWTKRYLITSQTTDNALVGSSTIKKKSWMHCTPPDHPFLDSPMIDLGRRGDIRCIRSYQLLVSVSVSAFWLLEVDKIFRTYFFSE